MSSSSVNSAVGIGKWITSVGRRDKHSLILFPSTAAGFVLWLLSTSLRFTALTECNRAVLQPARLISRLVTKAAMGCELAPKEAPDGLELATFGGSWVHKENPSRNLDTLAP